MCDQSTSTASVDEPAADPALLRTLAAAGMPASGRFVPRAGWVSRAWIGDEYVVRLSNGQFRDAFHHEARVVNLLAGSEVPHARHLAHGDGPDGPWYISERLPGRTLHEVWPAADLPTRKAMIGSLGAALRALHRVPVPAALLPPWLADALAGEPRSAYHPPVVSAAPQQVEDARRTPGHDICLITDVAEWILERLALFAADEPVLVHGDVHGSNVIVDQGRVTGLIDFAEALAQPADVELDTILRWCARAREYPSTPDERGLDETTLTRVPGWLHGAYPELFEREHLRERLLFHDMQRELALYAHHPQPDMREAARDRIARLLSGHNHLDELVWYVVVSTFSVSTTVPPRKPAPGCVEGPVAPARDNSPPPRRDHGIRTSSMWRRRCVDRIQTRAPSLGTRPRAAGPPPSPVPAKRRPAPRACPERGRSPSRMGAQVRGDASGGWAVRVKRYGLTPVLTIGHDGLGGDAMKPSDRLAIHREEIRRIVETYRATNPRVFGSVVRDEDRETSDLDILVDPGADTSLFDIGAIQYEINLLLGVPIDILTPNALPAKMRESVLAEARPI